MGLIGGILQPLYGGFPVVLLSPVDFLKRPLRWLKAVSRYGATTSGGPNFAYDLCARKVTPEERDTLDLSRSEPGLQRRRAAPATHARAASRTVRPVRLQDGGLLPRYGLAEGTLHRLRWARRRRRCCARWTPPR